MGSTVLLTGTLRRFEGIYWAEELKKKESGLASHSCTNSTVVLLVVSSAKPRRKILLLYSML
jgi:hypothetical protein